MILLSFELKVRVLKRENNISLKTKTTTETNGWVKFKHEIDELCNYVFKRDETFFVIYIYILIF